MGYISKKVAAYGQFVLVFILLESFNLFMVVIYKYPEFVRHYFVGVGLQFSSIYYSWYYNQTLPQNTLHSKIHSISAML